MEKTPIKNNQNIDFHYETTTALEKQIKELE